jgi:DNA-binding response OmpR family regulator
MTPLRILIAEDDAMIAILLSDVLAAMGHEVCAVTETESDTIAAALLYKPDLMIVDEGLRDGSGIAAVAEIGLTKLMPHIFATSDCYRVLKAQPKSIVLQKPFDVQTLVRAIERAV